MLRRLEAEMKRASSRETSKVIPTTGDKAEEHWLQHFDDLYGYRGNHKSVFLLNPWEFVSLWEFVRIDACPAFSADDKDKVAYPRIPGKVQLQDRFYMRRLSVPLVPAPSHTRMPEKEKTQEARARLYSVYLRPWVLDPRYVAILFIAAWLLHGCLNCDYAEFKPCH